MGIYDLFDVSIGGEVIMARPIEWSDVDEGDGVGPDGNPIRVLKYNGTCPKCAQLLEFVPEDVAEFGEVATVICQICGAGPTDEQIGESVTIQHIATEDKYTFGDNQAVISPGNEPRPREKKEGEITIKPTVDDCPFQDPVEAGELRPAT